MLAFADLRSHSAALVPTVGIICLALHSAPGPLPGGLFSSVAYLLDSCKPGMALMRAAHTPAATLADAHSAETEAVTEPVAVRPADAVTVLTLVGRIDFLAVHAGTALHSPSSSGH